MSEAPAPPPAEGLLALGADDWAWLLGHVRRALHDLDGDAVTPVVARLRASPSGRLAGGRPRRDLVRLLASDGPAWRALAARLADVEVPGSVASVLAGAAPQAPGPAPRAGAARPPSTEPDAERARLRERLRALRDERDDLRRRLAGADARADAEAEAARTARDERDAARAARDAAEGAAADHAQDLARAVARERRRGEARASRLEAELTEARRLLDEARRRAQRAAEPPRAAPARGAEQARPGPPAASHLQPGRPSRLPDGVVAGTREAVDVLLHPGRLVLVDGYNLTKQHHPELDLAGQRAWLEQLLATLAARRKVRPEVIFDGSAAGSRPAGRGRDVRVRFTPDGVTADDELVLAVEATDEPVLVVTDDRELVGRLRASGADVVGTREFLWATR